MDYSVNHFESVWAVKLLLDSSNSSDIESRLWATGEVTIGEDIYEPLIVDNGIIFSDSTTDILGGYNPLNNEVTISVINVENESEILSNYVLVNDTVIVYLVQLLNGVYHDHVKFFEGKIYNRNINKSLWNIKAKNKLGKLIINYPTKLITPLSLPDTSPDNFGKVEPIVLGKFDISPFDNIGRAARLAPCVDTQATWVGGFTSGFYNNSYDELYDLKDGEYYEILDQSETPENHVRNVDSSRRRFRMYLGAPSQDNRAINWQNLSNGKDEGIFNPSSMANNDILSLFFASRAKQGAINSVKLVMRRTDLIAFSTNEWYSLTINNENLTIFLDSNITVDEREGTLIHSIDWTNKDWDDLAEIKLTMNNQHVELKQVYLEIEFTIIDQERVPNIVQKVTGVAPNPVLLGFAEQYDGDISIENPVHHVLVILCHSSMMNIPVNLIDLNSFKIAATVRNEWKFSHIINNINNKDSLRRLLVEAGLTLVEHNGLIAIRAASSEPEPVGAIIGEEHILNENNNPLFSLDLTPEDRIINNIPLRYNRDENIDKYSEIYIAGSLAYNVESLLGTVTINDDGDAFLEGAFNTTNYREGEDLVYIVKNGGLYKISDIITVNRLKLLNTDNSNYSGSEGQTEFFVGPNLNVKSIRSVYRNKVVRSFGGFTPNFIDLGSYNHLYIKDEITAKKWAEFYLDWFSQSRIIGKGTSFWHIADLVVGDIILFDDYLLPTKYRPKLINYIRVLNSNGAQRLEIKYNTLQPNDYIYVRDEGSLEIMKVLTIYDDFKVDVQRGLFNTPTITLNVDSEIRRFEKKFRLKSIKPFPHRLKWDFTIDQVPSIYYPVPVLINNRGHIYNEHVNTDLDKVLGAYMSNNNNLYNEKENEDLGMTTVETLPAEAPP